MAHAKNAVSIGGIFSQEETCSRVHLLFFVVPEINTTTFTPTPED